MIKAPNNMDDETWQFFKWFLKDYHKSSIYKETVDRVLSEVQKLRTKRIDIYAIPSDCYFTLIIWIHDNYLLLGELDDIESLLKIMESAKYPYQPLGVNDNNTVINQITPEQKAKELYQKFFISTPQPYTLDNVEHNGKELMFETWDKQWTVNMAKSQAIICVDEIMKYIASSEIEYWNKVKEEIYKK